MASPLATLFMPAGMQPYDPQRFAPQDVGFGGPSTEYLATNDAPEGFGAWNVPQVWWTSGGRPAVVTPEQAQAMATDYEAITGQRFPRFMGPGVGAERAMNRSAMGGAQTSPLASMFGGWQ